MSENSGVWSKLGKIDSTLKQGLPLVMYVFAVFFLLDSLFRLGYFDAIGEYPRLVVFLTGAWFWLSAGIVRDEQKRVSRLERRNRLLEESRDLYKELWEEQGELIDKHIDTSERTDDAI